MTIRTILVAVVVLGVGGVVVLVTGLRLLSSYQTATAQDKRMTSAFVPSRANQIAVSVRGWGDAEIGQIVSDFLRLYHVPAVSASAVQITARADGVSVLKFPSDIEPKLLYFLVNYIQYPKNFDLKHRSIGVLCHVVLTQGFGISEQGLVGKRAQIYVPAGDTDYDLVYAKIETGEVYKISFADLIWRRVEGARIPETVGGL